MCVFQDAREDNGVAFAVPVRREAESTYLRGNTSPQVSYGLGHIAGLSSVRLRGGGYLYDVGEAGMFAHVQKTLSTQVRYI